MAPLLYEYRCRQAGMMCEKVVSYAGRHWSVKSDDNDLHI